MTHYNTCACTAKTSTTYTNDTVISLGNDSRLVLLMCMYIYIYIYVIVLLSARFSVCSFLQSFVVVVVSRCVHNILIIASRRPKANHTQHITDLKSQSQLPDKSPLAHKIIVRFSIPMYNVCTTETTPLSISSWEQHVVWCWRDRSVSGGRESVFCRQNTQSMPMPASNISHTLLMGFQNPQPHFIPISGATGCCLQPQRAAFVLYCRLIEEYIIARSDWRSYMFCLCCPSPKVWGEWRGCRVEVQLCIVAEKEGAGRKFNFAKNRGIMVYEW